MPQGGFTVGQDFSMVCTFPFQTEPETFKDGTMFESSPITSEVDVIRISGSITPLNFQLGWKGTITQDRDGSGLDDIWDRMEAGYYSGEDLTGSTIQITIKEPDGSVSKYLYTDVQYVLQDAGSYKGNDKVTQTLTWRAARRTKLV